MKATLFFGYLFTAGFVADMVEQDLIHPLWLLLVAALGFLGCSIISLAEQIKKRVKR